jgi:urease accessory protein UreE
MLSPPVTFQHHFLEVMVEALYAIIIHLMIQNSHALGNNHVRLQLNNSEIHQHKL